MNVFTESPRAMILAAGKGTRLRPLTDRMPKALVPVNGMPLVEHQLRNLKKFGFTDIIVNVHHFADMLCDYLQKETDSGVKISISSEREKLLNTGGALRNAKDFLLSGNYNKPVLIHNVDILSNANLKELFTEAMNHDATLLVSWRKTSRYLLFDPNDMRLVGWTNVSTGEVKSPYENLDVSACKQYAFSGIHVISPLLLKEMESWPDEFSIIDFYLKLCRDFDIHAEVSPTLKLMDVGKMETLSEADAFDKNLN